jgi:succinyl-CoA synthetase alpha subunit
MTKKPTEEEIHKLFLAALRGNSHQHFALISGTDDTAQAKMAIMRECGITVCESPADIGLTLDSIYKK